LVFVHGFLGFREKRVLGRRIQYFRGVAQALADMDMPLYFPALPPTHCVAERATSLAAQLASYPERNLALIGHSMGGLDARYFASLLDNDHRVRCVIAIGTPHRGTPVARWLLETEGVYQRFARRHWNPALAELAPQSCATRNVALPDRGDVRYLSYAGMRPVCEQSPVLRPFGKLIEREMGANDGLVPVSSAAWGEFQGTVRADHLEQPGWSLALPRRALERPFDHIEFFRGLAARARAMSMPPAFDVRADSPQML
jgi:triacylglycerol lipase